MILPQAPCYCFPCLPPHRGTFLTRWVTCHLPPFPLLAFPPTGPERTFCAFSHLLPLPACHLPATLCLWSSFQSLWDQGRMSVLSPSVDMPFFCLLHLTPTLPEHCRPSVMILPHTCTPQFPARAACYSGACISTTTTFLFPAFFPSLLFPIHREHPTFKHYTLLLPSLSQLPFPTM